MTDDYVDLNPPSGAVHITITQDRPSEIIFTVSADAHERPESELLRHMAHYLNEMAFERLVIDALTFQYVEDENRPGGTTIVASLYTRSPMTWVEYDPDV